MKRQHSINMSGEKSATDPHLMGHYQICLQCYGLLQYMRQLSFIEGQLQGRFILIQVSEVFSKAVTLCWQA